MLGDDGEREEGLETKLSERKEQRTRENVVNEIEETHLSPQAHHKGGSLSLSNLKVWQSSKKFCLFFGCARVELMC